jgi:hypothetical protein
MKKADPHKLTFEGKGPSTMGACGTVFLQGLGHGTEQQQVRAQHDKHLVNIAWMEDLLGREEPPK